MHQQTTFNCELCDKTFTQKRLLKRHEVIHTNLLPHVCCHCAQGFHHSTQLYRHERKFHANFFSLQPYHVQYELCKLNGITKYYNTSVLLAPHVFITSHLCIYDLTNAILKLAKSEPIRTNLKKIPYIYNLSIS